MIPGMNKRQVEQAMKKMGIQQTELDAEEVIIRTAEKDIIISNPSVAIVKMMGQESFQISGKVSEKARSSMPSISEDDIQTVMQQTSCSKDEAITAINNAKGDLAEAIISLKE